MSVHNIRKERMAEGDVYIGRAGNGQDGFFGNPIRLANEAARGSTLVAFEAYARNRLARDMDYRERVKALQGKRLFCFCAPHACHGDVLEKLSAELNN